jgi:hypothetical protein
MSPISNIEWSDLGRADDGTFYAELKLGEHEIVFAMRSPQVPQPPRELPFVPTDFQRLILKALDGRALKKEPLADELCGGHGSRLYRSGGLAELTERGIVVNKPGAGYYRPDRSPTDWRPKSAPAARRALVKTCHCSAVIAADRPSITNGVCHGS